MLGNGLELFVQPFTKSIQKAATVANNGSGFPRLLVDFGSDIEVAVGVFTLFK